MLETVSIITLTMPAVFLLALRGKSDSNPSMLRELPCEYICGSPKQAEIMLLCNWCNKGAHTTYWKPSPSGVPKTPWVCPVRDSDKDSAEPLPEPAAEFDLT